MLQSMLSVWDKKEEKYSFINANPEVKKVLKSVLPPTIAISRSTLSSTDTKVSFGNLTTQIICIQFEQRVVRTLVMIFLLIYCLDESSSCSAELKIEYP